VRLLFILDNYWPHVGGMETLFANVCEGMAAAGHSVTVLSRGVTGAPANERRNGVAISRVSAKTRYAFPFLAFPKALRLAAGAELIATATFASAPLGSLVGFLRRLPVVVTVPEVWIGKWTICSTLTGFNAWVHDVLERLIFTFPFSTYIGISQSTTRELAKALGSRTARVETIYCGFDPVPWERAGNRAEARARYGLSERDYLIVGYGRPGISKGFRYLVDAFPAIRRARPEARLVLVLSATSDTRAEFGELKRRADPAIVFSNSLPIDRLRELVGAADCVVVPSLSEGFGYTTLEAASAGTCVVASNTTSIPEVIGGKYLLVEPADSDAIARGVLAVARGDYERRPVPRFAWSVTLAEYAASYARAIARGRTNRSR
jgi:glycosyltransferase involved in cell wall biosynthesis